MIFRQLFDRESCTFSYLMADAQTKEGILIDPVLSLAERDLQLIDQLGLQLLYVVETHVHADHVTAAATLRKATEAKLAWSSTAKVPAADHHLDHGEHLHFGGLSLETRHTPGHTEGCTSYLLLGAPESAIFTGDTLSIRGCGRTDFQGGDAATLYQSVREQIFSLPDDTLIYPGHDYKGRTRSTVAEEKAHNPRLNQQINETEFVGIMNSLNLAYPKHMDVAVPANQRGGVMP